VIRPDATVGEKPPPPSTESGACKICLSVDHVPESRRVYVDSRWVAAIFDGLEVPGWIVLSLRRHAEGFSAMTPAEASTLGPVVSRLAGAIEVATGAERVYLAGFGERHPHLHLLLAPRGAEVPHERRHAALLLNPDSYLDVPEAELAGERIRRALSQHPADDAERAGRSSEAGP
jgi:diadenosine tetraphosphate (Ap4A) HIT family hydrolase